VRAQVSAETGDFIQHTDRGELVFVLFLYFISTI